MTTIATPEHVHLLKHADVLCSCLPAPSNLAAKMGVVAHLPCSLCQAFADEQVLARNLKLNQPLSPDAKAKTAIESIATVASPLRLIDTPPVLHRAPPLLGEHTDEVLSALGLNAAAVSALRARGVVA